MSTQRIPSAENLLGLAYHSCRLTQLIRDYLPVDPEIVPPILLGRTEGYLAQCNLIGEALQAVNWDERANAETGSPPYSFRVSNWSLFVTPAWRGTAVALQDILAHYGWTSLRGARAYTVYSEGCTATVDGREVPIHESRAPGVAAIRWEPLRSPIPARLLDTLDHYAGALQREVCMVLSAGGAALEPAGGESPPSAKGRYVFARRKNKFRLRFDGEEGTPRLLKGLLMTEYLLKQPGKQGDVLEIEAALAEDRPLRTIGEGEGLASGEKDGEVRWNGFTRGVDSAVEAATAEEIAEAEAAVRQLQEQSHDADLRGDAKRVKELDSKVESGQTWLKEQKRLQRRGECRRGTDSPKEAARQRLKNALADALTQLRDEGMPLLAGHLDRQIKYESHAYKYNPVEGVEWVFDEPTR
jgi:hypothetical protein